MPALLEALVGLVGEAKSHRHGEMIAVAAVAVFAVSEGFWMAPLVGR